MTIWRSIAIAAVSCLLVAEASAGDVIYAVPNNDWRLVLQRFEPRAIRGPDGQPVPAPVVSLSEALATAWPGVTIQLLPGIYKQDTPEDGILFPRNGSLDQPITLRGMGSDTVIDGTAKSGFRVFGIEITRPSDEVSTLLRPDFRGGSICFRFDRKQWIVLDNLTLRNCADAAVIARDSQYITLKNSTILAGLYAFFAEGPNTHHLLLERNIWVQDPSEEMWSKKHWCEYKYGTLKSQAGALFAGLDIAGDVIIRGNRVQHAFNAVRIDVSTARRADPAWRGKLSANIEVYDNDFAFIRDNVLEPEFDATNWWFHDNRIRNAHAWFSFDGLYGGRWYVYDNVGWFDDKPSRICKASGACELWQKRNPELCADLHDGGRVFKFRPDGQYAPGPLYIFNNSWFLRTSIIKDGALGRLDHWNNAIDFCRPEDYPDGLCEPGKPFFNGFSWSDKRYSFKHDVSNHPDFPVTLQALGYHVQGTGVPNRKPLFLDGPHGDFTLPEGSPVRGAGCIVRQKSDGSLKCREPGAREQGPDAGAHLDGGSSEPVRFLHYDGGLYKEAPRMVHVELPDATAGRLLLRIAFSTPIVLAGSDVRAEFDYGADDPVRSEPCAAKGRVLTCPVAPPPDAPLRAVKLDNAIVSAEGELATEWGGVSDLVTLRR
ncbi:MAG: hypothetical protein ACREEP_06660 [Dongiaceae bacterium]